MKKIFTKPLLLASFLFADIIYLKAQACLPPTAKDSLDINNIRAIYHPSAQLWFDPSPLSYAIVSPSQGEPRLPLGLAGGLWLAGKDPSGQLNIAAHTFHAFNSDYWAGPLDLATGTTADSTCMYFNKLWKISRANIEAHQSDFNDNGIIDGTVPFAVLAWPGRNNPNSFFGNGFHLPADQPLAPFVDRNGNGNYEPMLGDYPDVKGDQALWWVFNDQGGGAFHEETNGHTIQAEIHAMAYALKGENNETLFNTVFLEFEIFNRRQELLDSMYASLFIDFDLGFYFEDLLGCIPDNQIFFAYTSSGVLNSDCFTTPEDDCIEVPILMLKQLQGPKNEMGEDVGFSSFIAYNNPNFGGPPLNTTDPVIDFEYYNYMQGTWRNGQPLTFGEDGLNPDNPTTNFLFPGNPADSSGWSMCTVDLPNYDIRTMINSGPFSLMPGESTKVAYAVTPVFVEDYPCPDVTPLIEVGDELQEVYDGLTAVQYIAGNHTNIHFYPNPMGTEGKLVLDDNPYFIQKAEFFDMGGRWIKSFDNLQTRELTIRRDDLPAGMYFYKILTSNGQWGIGKFLIH